MFTEAGSSSGSVKIKKKCLVLVFGRTGSGGERASVSIAKNGVVFASCSTAGEYYPNDTDQIVVYTNCVSGDILQFGRSGDTNRCGGICIGV